MLLEPTEKEGWQRGEDLASGRK